MKKSCGIDITEILRLFDEKTYPFFQGKHVISISCIVMLFCISCTNQNQATNIQSTRDDPILRQLERIHQDIKKLHIEMGTLQKTVANIRLPTTLTKIPKNNRSLPSKIVFDDDDPILGDRKAKVAIIEFSDFQCPYCARFHTEVFPSIKMQYIDTGKVQYVIRDFPLKFHPKAKMAAIVANCADQQGAYWKMKDLLFKQQRELGNKLYKNIAQKLNLVQVKLESCMKRTEMIKEVESDLDFGQQIGVRGTPTFFIGRVKSNQIVDIKRIVGAQTLPAFTKAIRSLHRSEEK